MFKYSSPMLAWFIELFFGVPSEDTASNEADVQPSNITVYDASSQGEQDAASVGTDVKSSSTSSQWEQDAASVKPDEQLFQQAMLLNDDSAYKQAGELFQQAINLSHGQSHAQLANMLIEGRPGLPKDVNYAYHLALAGTALGCEHSKGVLAQCLVFGLGIPKDRQKGLALATESAEAGSCFGLFVVGFSFLIEKESQANNYLMRASTSGSVDALYRLGRMYEEGNLTFSDGSHCFRNLKTAFSYFSRAAKRGHIKSMLLVANWYEQGKGGANVDIPRALSILREIANGSDQFYCDVHRKIIELSQDPEEIKAMIMLMVPVADVAYCFEKWNNKTVRLNAVALYQILADKGHRNSQVWLAEDALKKKEYAPAAEYLRLAADQGHADSMCKLADLVQHGSGVAKDQCEAARLYRVAAEKGHQQSQLNLSYVLGEGIGVVQDKQEARKWLTLCAQQGNKQALFLLK